MDNPYNPYDPRTVEAICDMWELMWRETLDMLRDMVDEP